MEAIGVQLFRTQVKRRKASMAGKSAPSDEAQYPLVSWAYWRRDGCKVSCSYPGRSAGFRRCGRPEVKRRPKARQKSENRVVPEGR